jgi:hypothetical protein
VTWLAQALVISRGDVSCLTLEDVVLNEGIVVCDGLVAATLIQKALDLDDHLPRGLHPLRHAALSCCGGTCSRLCLLLALATDQRWLATNLWPSLCCTMQIILPGDSSLHAKGEPQDPPTDFRREENSKVGKSRGRCKSSTMDSTLVDSLNNERVTMGMRQCHTAILQCVTQSRVIGWSQAIDTFLFVFGTASMPRISSGVELKY